MKIRAPVMWGIVWAGIQIASVYIGFAVADGRWLVIAFETNVAAIFVIIAAAAVTQSPWLLVVGLAGHGLKDLCAVEIVAGVQFHG